MRTRSARRPSRGRPGAAGQDQTEAFESRSQRLFRIVLVAAILLAAGAWGSSIFITSPREAAARASAPQPSLIAVPAQVRRVGDAVVTRGVVQATQTVQVISQLASPEVDRSLISGRIPSLGDEVEAGTVVVEISGRPVIALVGPVPTYRSLKPGDSGPDVAQLRKALTNVGLASRDDEGEYGKSTDAAVKALYRQVGYSAPEGGGVPANEIVYVSALPASVVAVNASLGTDVSQASIEVASGRLVIVAQLPAGQAPLVKAGARVVVSAETFGKSVKGRVVNPSSTDSPSSGGSAVDGPRPGGPTTQNDDVQPDDVASSPPADAQVAPEATDGAPTSDFVVVPDKDISGSWAGQDVRVRVISAQTEGKVLAVPVAAIFMNGSGNSEVVVVNGHAKSLGDANPHAVQVKVGVTGGGWVQVDPISKSSRLREGAAVQLSDPLKPDADK